MNTNADKSPPLPGSERMAPVQGYSAGIPWSIHLEAYDAYCKRYSKQQALIEGGCRGGFGVQELDALIPGWRDRVSEIGRMRTRIAELEQRLAALTDGAEPVGLPFTDAVIDKMQDVMAMHNFAVPVRVISDAFRTTMFALSAVSATPGGESDDCPFCGRKGKHLPDEDCPALNDPKRFGLSTPAPAESLEDTVDAALTAYNRADYQWVKLDKDNRDEPRHRFSMRAVVKALTTLRAVSGGRGDVTAEPLAWYVPGKFEGCRLWLSENGAKEYADYCKSEAIPLGPITTPADPALPDGWVMVPKVPTHAMLQAATQSQGEMVLLRESTRIRREWGAMLAAVDGGRHA